MSLMCAVGVRYEQCNGASDKQAQNKIQDAAGLQKYGGNDEWAVAAVANLGRVRHDMSELLTACSRWMMRANPKRGHLQSTINLPTRRGTITATINLGDYYVLETTWAADADFASSNLTYWQYPATGHCRMHLSRRFESLCRKVARDGGAPIKPARLLMQVDAVIDVSQLDRRAVLVGHAFERVGQVDYGFVLAAGARIVFPQRQFR